LVRNVADRVGVGVAPSARGAANLPAGRIARVVCLYLAVLATA